MPGFILCVLSYPALNNSLYLPNLPKYCMLLIFCLWLPACSRTPWLHRLHPINQTAFAVTSITFLLVTSPANYTISCFSINPNRLTQNRLQPFMMSIHSADYVTDAWIRDDIEFPRVFPPRALRKILNSELCFLVCVGLQLLSPGLYAVSIWLNYEKI